METEKICKFVLGECVICNSAGSKNRDCKKCGWNPNVAWKRKMAVKGIKIGG